VCHGDTNGETTTVSVHEEATVLRGKLKKLCLFISEETVQELDTVRFQIFGCGENQRVVFRGVKPFVW
jgi:hypothetical protein